MEHQDAYKQRIDAQVKEWSARVDQLHAKAQKVEAQLKLEYLEDVGLLRSKLDALKAKLDQLDQAKNDAWDALKASVETGVEEFKKTYRNARAQRELMPSTEPEGGGPATQ